MTTRVNIIGDGHQVEVSTDNADLSYVTEKAQKLWAETKPVDNRVQPVGFSAVAK